MAPSLKALRGSITIGNAMPLDEQFITGQLNVDDIELVSRTIAMTFLVKADQTLYEKMMYDPAQSGTWTAEIFREADMVMEFETGANIPDATDPYKLSFHVNGQSDSDANVAWSVAPINLQGNRQVTMAITAMVLADTFGATDGPFSAQLINTTPAY